MTVRADVGMERGDFVRMTIATDKRITRALRQAQGGNLELVAV